VNRKKLPKVIRRTTNPIGAALAGNGAVAQPETFAAGAHFEPAAGSRTSALQPMPAAEKVGAAITSQDFVSPTARKDADPRVARRRSQATRIVERHAVYSGLGGFIPVPLANVASITAVIVRMVKVLSSLYGVPFQRDRARAIVIGLMGGAMPTGLATATTSTLVYIVPGSGLIGLAVSSLTAAACTRSIGRIFVEHFESGATLHDLPATNGAARQSRHNRR
jgi:uncharacterized protein (DUF697 family)